MTEFYTRYIEKPVLALVGPTAVGKTALAIGLSQRFNCEIISVDSMQVYRYMDIGTAKATKEEQQTVSHHLIDIVDPDEDYNAAQFSKDCLAAIEDIHNRGSIPLLTGGTGLYFRALKNGLFRSEPTDVSIKDTLKQRLEEEGSQILHEELRSHDPRSAERIHVNDGFRIIRALEVFLSTGTTMSDHFLGQNSEHAHVDFARFLSLGLSCDRDALYKRINARTVLLLESGLEEEVRSLLERGYDPNLKSMQSIGYRHMLQYLNGQWSLSECREYLARDTRRYAKRQLTWFNRDESIQWFDRNDGDGIIAYVDQELSI